MDQEGTDAQALIKEIQKRLDENCMDFGQKKEELWESLATCEEKLLEEYLEQGKIDDDNICLRIAERIVFPCWFGSALKGEGVEELLSGIARLMCCPGFPEKPGMKVFKISRDEQGNRLTHMKLTGGRLQVKDSLPGESAEKINQIRIYSGARYETVKEA